MIILELILQKEKDQREGVGQRKAHERQQRGLDGNLKYIDMQSDHCLDFLPARWEGDLSDERQERI